MELASLRMRVRFQGLCCSIFPRQFYCHRTLLQSFTLYLCVNQRLSLFIDLITYQTGLGQHCQQQQLLPCR
jgi:hypothetical protein